VKRLVLLVLSAGLLSAQSPDKGKQVVLDAVAALGGAKFSSMRNHVESGRAYSFYRAQLTGLSLATIYSEYLDHAPEHGVAIRERQAFGKKQDYSILFLPDQGYEITFRGARPLPDDRWKRYLSTTSTNIFYLLREKLNAPTMTFDFVRSDVVLNTQVNIVDVIDGDLTVRVYFDYNTKLPIRQEYSEWDPIGKQRRKEVTDYSKYRESNGVQWPFVTHRERDGEVTYEIFADRVDVDATIPPKTFDLPSGIKILKKMD
jgi:hypothetical protein